MTWTTSPAATRSVAPVKTKIPSDVAVLQSPVASCRKKPEFAAGSSLGAFLLLLAEEDRAYDERWPTGWQLKIDPDLYRCSRARAVWKYT